MRAWVAALLLAGCAPTEAVAPSTKTSSEPPTQRVAEHDDDDDLDVDDLDRPVVVRCPSTLVCQWVVRVRRTDGAITWRQLKQLVAGSAFVADEAHAFWFHGAFDLHTSASHPLDWPQRHPTRLDHDAHALLVFTASGLFAVPKNGKARRRIRDATNMVDASIDGDLLVWGETPGEVVLASRDGTVAQRIPAPGVTLVRAQKGIALWASQGRASHPAGGEKSGSVHAWIDGADQTIATNIRGIILDVTMTSDHIYWLTQLGTRRAAYRRALAGGPVERLGASHETATHDRNTDRMIVHGSHVYWNAGSSVVRVRVNRGLAATSAPPPAVIVVTLDHPGRIYGFAVTDEEVLVLASQVTR